MALSRRLVTLAAVVGIATPLAWVASMLTPGERAVRIRNAFVVRVGQPTDFTWSPEAAPQGFIANETEPYPEFTEAMASIAPNPGGQSDGLALGLAIARHLMSAPQPGGGAIRGALRETYRDIVLNGSGYCADFTQAFTGLALAANLPVRTWGVSFDGFGAGHAFNEVFDRGRGKWVMVDSFHSLYFVDSATREPLSVLELHDRLLSVGTVAGGVQLQRIVPNRFPFRSEALAIDYYRRGMPQLALSFGNNVFDYDRSLPVRWSGRVSRHLERVVAILVGQYPRMLVYPVAVSDRDLNALRRARARFVMATAALMASVVVFGGLLIEAWRSPSPDGAWGVA